MTIVDEIIEKHAKELAKDGWIFSTLIKEELEEDYEEYCNNDCSPAELVDYWKEGWRGTEQWNILHFTPLVDDLMDSFFGDIDVPIEKLMTKLDEDYFLSLLDIIDAVWEKAFEILKRERGIDIYALAEEVINEHKKSSKVGATSPGVKKIKVDKILKIDENGKVVGKLWNETVFVDIGAFAKYDDEGNPIRGNLPDGREVWFDKDLGEWVLYLNPESNPHITRAGNNKVVYADVDVVDRGEIITTWKSRKISLSPDQYEKYKRYRENPNVWGEVVKGHILPEGKEVYYLTDEQRWVYYKDSDLFAPTKASKEVRGMIRKLNSLSEIRTLLEILASARIQYGEIMNHDNFVKTLLNWDVTRVKAFNVGNKVAYVAETPQGVITTFGTENFSKFLQREKQIEVDWVTNPKEFKKWEEGGLL